MKKVPYILIFSFFVFGGGLWAQDSGLVLGPEDVAVEQRYDGGFHLFIKKKTGVNSVLITETTRDPSLQAHNYAYRAAEWNPVNGNEIRVIDNHPLALENGLYSLISSRLETHSTLGEVFHIFVPWVVQFGYENTRHGQVYISDGTYLNLRTFSLPYADYQGTFQDNPFVLRVIQKERAAGTPGIYLRATEETFSEIATDGGGFFVYSGGPADLVEKIRAILENEKGKTVDLVLCLDTTESMKNDIDAIRSSVVSMLREITPSFRDYRLGLLLYRDYYEEYLNRVIPFTRDFTEFQRSLDAILVRGGRDLPEAVYEALHEGAVSFPWEAESRLLILIGDAPPHPLERGSVTRAMVNSAVQEHSLKVSAVILPQ